MTSTTMNVREEIVECIIGVRIASRMANRTTCPSVEFEKGRLWGVLMLASRLGVIDNPNELDDLVRRTA